MSKKRRRLSTPVADHDMRSHLPRSSAPATVVSSTDLTFDAEGNVELTDGGTNVQDPMLMGDPAFTSTTDSFDDIFESFYPTRVPVDQDMTDSAELSNEAVQRILDTAGENHKKG